MFSYNHIARRLIYNDGLPLLLDFQFAGVFFLQNQLPGIKLAAALDWKGNFQQVFAILHIFRRMRFTPLTQYICMSTEYTCSYLGYTILKLKTTRVSVLRILSDSSY